MRRKSHQIDEGARRNKKEEKRRDRLLATGNPFLTY